ncbi:MAG: PhoU domain-containing protein [Candidatus Thorarchaeota archaeon]|nr:MAG: PhoU domain-containing protein [Candidatus Thorarchaeota archaeon]
MNPSLESINAEIVAHLKKLHRLVTTSLSKSMKVFEDLDIEAAVQNMETAQDIEILHHTIEDMAFGAIAGYGPIDINLRRLVSYIHTSSGLHRVGSMHTKSWR